MRLKTGAGLGHTQGRFGEFALSSLEFGELEFEFGDAIRFAGDALGEFGEVTLQRFDFGCGIATLGLDALESVAGGGEAGIVLVELASERLLGRTGIGELKPGGFELNGAQSGNGGSGFGPLFGFSEGCTCRTRTRSSNPPTAHTEAITGGGDHDGRGMGQ